MPFGKHKGRRLTELPQDYLEWLRTIELRGPLREAIADEWQRRTEPRPRRHALPAAVVPVAEELITCGLRALVKTAHPDLAGGSTGRMQAVNVAADWLRAVVRAGRPA